MDQAELQKQLNDGIRAVRAGDRARARELLLAVVQADEANEPAWLWLSAALDEPADQLRALENVLVLNPRQPQALAGAQKLRLALGIPIPAVLQPAPPMVEPAAGGHPAAPPVPAVPAPRTLGAATVGVDPTAGDEDPYQCAYCGRPTTADDTRCPHCGRSLLAPGLWYGGTYLYVTLILTGILFQTAMVEALAVFLRDSFPTALRIIPFASLLTTNLVAPAIVRVLLWMLVLFMLLDEASFAYRAALAVAVADLVWTGIAYGLGWLSPIIAGLNGGLAGIFGLLALSAVISQVQSRVRLKVVPARNITGAIALDRQAKLNARQGQWALAALHWQRAISRAPRDPKYYKSLGKAQVRLRRYTQAAQTFHYGTELDPADKEFSRLIEALSLNRNL
jgi:tetratricopeptide (TPR) repeat protein